MNIKIYISPFPIDMYRPASAGKPRIPPDAEITFDVEMVGLPGKEPELIELIGDV
jgi:peptidylprolyl isomerase